MSKSAFIRRAAELQNVPYRELPLVGPTKTVVVKAWLGPNAYRSNTGRTPEEALANLKAVDAVEPPIPFESYERIEYVTYGED